MRFTRDFGLALYSIKRNDWTALRPNGKSKKAETIERRAARWCGTVVTDLSGKRREENESRDIIWTIKRERERKIRHRREKKRIKLVTATD